MSDDRPDPTEGYDGEAPGWPLPSEDETETTWTTQPPAAPGEPAPTWTPDAVTDPHPETPTSVDPLLPPPPPVPPPVAPSWSTPAPPPAAQFGGPAPAYPAAPQFGGPPAGQYGPPVPPGQYGAPTYGGYAPPPLPGVAGWGAVPVAPKPGVIPLRPLGVGEILDGAISYMRRDPKTVLGISAIIASASALMQFALYSGMGRWFDSVLSNPALSESGNPSSEDVSGLVGGFAALAGAFLLVWAITFLLSVLATGMLTTAMGRAVLGQPVSTSDVWQRARERFWPLLGLTLLVGLVLVGAGAGGTLVAVAVGAVLEQVANGLGILVGLLLGLATVLVTIWLAIKLLLAPVALVLEGVGVTTAMRRSYRLTAGAWWRTFGIYLLAAIIAAVVAQVITVPFSLIGGIGSVTTGSGANPFTTSQAFVTALATLVSQTVVVPFSAGIVALLYIDRRIRREALDIELARAAGVPAAPRP